MDFLLNAKLHYITREYYTTAPRGATPTTPAVRTAIQLDITWFPAAEHRPIKRTASLLRADGYIIITFELLMLFQKLESHTFFCFKKAWSFFNRSFSMRNSSIFLSFFRSYVELKSAFPCPGNALSPFSSYLLIHRRRLLPLIPNSLLFHLPSAERRSDWLWIHRLESK